MESWPVQIHEIRMQPDTILCPGAEVCFEFDKPWGAQEFEWNIPENMLLLRGGGKNDLFACCLVEYSGGGLLSITPFDYCYSGFPKQLPIVSVSIPPAFWPPKYMCQSDLPFDTIIKGKHFSFDSFGEKEIRIITELGCDSIIKVPLFPKNPPLFIDTLIATGSCVMFEDSCYSELGYHEIILENSILTHGCDSIINLFIEHDSSLISSIFSFDRVVCQGETTIVAYTGNASIDAIYFWNFGTATIQSGVGKGPYVLTFPEAGDYPVQLFVEENGSISSTTTHVIKVQPELLPLMINCFYSYDKMGFKWAQDSTVSNYYFNVLSGQNGSFDGSSFFFSGLNENEEVILELTAESQYGCSSLIESKTCFFRDCPSINIGIEEITNLFCEGDSSIIQLEVKNDSPTQNGTYTWSGTGVSSDGKFNTSGLTSGDYPVKVIYKEMGCDYENILTLKINRKPEINATVFSPVWSLERGNIGTSITNGLPPYQYNWSNGSNLPSISVTPGQYCLTVTDANTCFSTTCYQINEGFNVKPLHIICEGDAAYLSVEPPTGATFIWHPIINLGCSNCPSTVAKPKKTTVYSVIANFPDGRSVDQNVVVVVLPNIFCNGLPIGDQEDYSKLLSKYDFQNLTEKNLIDMETQITNLFLEKEIKIAPNPTNGKVTILTNKKIERVEVFDINGKPIMTHFKKEIDLSKLSKGVYFFKIKVNNQLVVKRVILI